MKNIKITFVSIIFVLGACTIIMAQEIVERKTLTRGQMWYCGLPNGSFEREQGMGDAPWMLIYPGYWGANHNRANGGWDATLIYNHAQVADEDVGWYYRGGEYDNADIFAVEQSQLFQNYNLTDPTQPEEYITGIIGSNKIVDNKRHIAYELEGKIMVWSVPKYDDFIILKCRLTNVDDVRFENFYYSVFFSMSGPAAPSGVTVGWDVEYLWDDEVSSELGFIFYDDTSIPPTTDSPVYEIPPGDSTGNAGDPGNIGTQGSTDYRLYSPFLYAYTFLPSSITPNKNGEQKVWRNILSSATNAPPEELKPETFQQMKDYQTAVNLITGHGQPEIGWREAHAIYQPGNKAGSLWERNPAYIYSIGPYDLNPGEAIEWIELWLCGQMDRNVSMKGGYEATTRFVEEGLVNLKENWIAAQQLIENNFAIPYGDIPPATPADAPRIGNANELLVEPASATINNEFKNGVNIIWPAVHIGYTDPQKNTNDFAGYRIYRSDVSIEGPWQLIDEITVDEADALVDGNTITLFEEAFTGVPYRYCVTSFDTDGNESGKTAYNFFPVSAEFQPSNTLSNVRVVPNPFRQASGFADPGETKRLAFINIPSNCIIRIYNVSLDLVKTIRHDNPQSGLTTWGSAENDDYMLTDFALNVAPGIYIYHIESLVPEHKGDTAVGKFAILR